MKQKIFTFGFLGILFIATSGLSACNTAEGFGQDVEKAGQKIQDAID